MEKIDLKQWQKAKSILCIRLDAMGDVLMTEPALRALKKTKKGRKITLLTSQVGTSAARLIPSVDEIITVNVPWEKNAESMTPKQTSHLIGKLKKCHFDAAIIFNTFSQTPFPAAILAYMACIPLRAAYTRQKPYQLLSQWIKEKEPYQLIRHEVDRQLTLVELLGNPRPEDERIHIHIHRTAYRSLESKLNKLGINAYDSYVIIQPGVSSLARQYSPTSYARIARRIYKEFGLPIVFSGNKDEVDLVTSIQSEAKIPTQNLAGKLSLEEVAAFIDQATLLISNNTGPVHIAAAVQTPVLDLYALTNPQHTPWKVKSKVLYFNVTKNLRDSVTLDTPPLTGEPLKNFATIMQSIHELLKVKNKNLPTRRRIHEERSERTPRNSTI